MPHYLVVKKVVSRHEVGANLHPGKSPSMVVVLECGHTVLGYPSELGGEGKNARATGHGCRICSAEEQKKRDAAKEKVAAKPVRAALVRAQPDAKQVESIAISLQELARALSAVNARIDGLENVLTTPKDAAPVVTNGVNHSAA